MPCSKFLLEFIQPGIFITMMKGLKIMNIIQIRKALCIENLTMFNMKNKQHMEMMEWATNSTTFFVKGQRNLFKYLRNVWDINSYRYNKIYLSHILWKCHRHCIIPYICLWVRSSTSLLIPMQILLLSNMVPKHRFIVSAIDETRLYLNLSGSFSSKKKNWKKNLEIKRLQILSFNWF